MRDTQTLSSILKLDFSKLIIFRFILCCFTEKSFNLQKIEISKNIERFIEGLVYVYYIYIFVKIS